MLLDTNIVIYLMTGSRTLPDAVMRRLRDPEEHRSFSLASFWEMTIKHGKGKLPLPAPFAEEPVETFEHWCARAVIDIVPIAPRHMARAMRLDFPNSDPFDRLIAATALCEDLELVTSDAGFRKVRRVAGDRSLSDLIVVFGLSLSFKIDRSHCRA